MSIFMLPSTRDRIEDLENRVRKSTEAYAEAQAEANAAQTELSIVKATREADKRNADAVTSRLNLENERLESVNEALNTEIAELAAELLDLRKALTELRKASQTQTRGGDDSGSAEAQATRIAAVEVAIKRYSPSNPVVRAVRGALGTPA